VQFDWLPRVIPPFSSNSLKSSPHQLETFPYHQLASKFSLQPWHPSPWLMQPSRLVFSFDHLTSALFCLGPSTSLNTSSLADPGCRRSSALDYTQTLLPLVPLQNPPGLLRARNLLDLRIRTGFPLRPGVRSGAGARLGARLWQLVLYVQAPFYVSIKTC
jgi:hypothetical protein